jgi:hypothetical protein
MTDDRFDELMRDAAREYRVPPAAPLDAMWSEIERASWGRRSTGTRFRGARIARVAPWLAAGIGMAATLMIGVAIGRRDATREPGSAGGVAGVAATASALQNEASPYRLATGRHLGQAAALLVALPGDVQEGGADSTLVEQANDLLSTTRILLDSPAAEDPEIQMLLRDLELVLAQVSRLSTRRAAPVDVQLITDAIEERDVLPRLRTVAAELPFTTGLD